MAQKKAGQNPGIQPCQIITLTVFTQVIGGYEYEVKADHDAATGHPIGRCYYGKPLRRVST